ncbi:hypothetical protein Skr01_27180 [Sphaerisporangium krabiense]|uniref:DUF6879 domain-containing protein n=1 Tax=Sphaerisporangium krabiense TaxID=763782 RepID=A0A7W9DTT1_9ACTN|nr:DUF6879 family protein [Sphaerisporangium krabiense]MBB5630414.1 hypothetical protein [Sphaerisporangium krabiense]GII62633.1 hypothetical protein Skr01_27180 [Sphaerisporangium krabiense]
MIPSTDDRLDHRAREASTVSEVFERARAAEAAVLPPEIYGPEFRAAYESAEGVVWKLERLQHFSEPYEPSWVAMTEGDWERSLRLIGEMRGSLPADYEGYAEFRRARVVESPLTPYMQWELHVLAARADAGERPRVVPASAVRPYEPSGPLPELLVLSPGLMYEVLYDAAGAHLGGRRITDPKVIAPCLAVLKDLYEQGEELRAYVRREVAELPAPAARSGA